MGEVKLRDECQQFRFLDILDKGGDGDEVYPLAERIVELTLAAEKPEEAVKWMLRQLYYRQKEYQEATGEFAATATALKASDICSAEQVAKMTVERTASLFEISLPAADGSVWRINQDGFVWK